MVAWTFSACDLKAAESINSNKGDKVMVVLTTSMGDITVELDAAKAPLSVKNFLAYVEEGFFDGTIFHRVIPGFMVQCGGMLPDMKEKRTHAPIKNEANNGLKNTRGTLAMARTQVVDSATSQFFINVADNVFLDHGGRDFGYAVFGRVVKGMEVVDQIVGVPTGNRAGHQNVPLQPITIVKAQRLEQ
ncbi:MAG: peptidylprolyl isomerase [Magnetococcales bacterium]|nr:peptidylprolyl isomerase [Magnetococcales bacterium]MBF0321367.1 peptidylprolyl isomerase [Magnetococcales bacterium]